MTIASEIARLQGVKSDILGAIAEKKVDVPTGAMLADAPELIRSIKSGINVKIGQGVYPAVKIGNQLWLARNLDEELGTLGVDEWYYNGRSSSTSYIKTSSFGPIQIPSGKTIYDPKPFILDAVDASIAKSTTDYKRLPKGNHKLYITCDFTINKTISSNCSVSFTVRVLKNDGTMTNTWVGGASIQAGTTTLHYSKSIQVLDGEMVSQIYPTISQSSGEEVILTCNNLSLTYDTEGVANPISFDVALANEATAKANNYGRLYTWNNFSANIGKLGFSKWRLPTKVDYDKLIAIDSTGKKFRKKGWLGGTDEFGICFEGSGLRNYSLNPPFTLVGVRFVSATVEQNSGISVIQLTGERFIAETSGYYANKGFGFSLRLVMDLNDDGTIPDSNIVLEDVPATTAEPLALASEPIVDEEEE